MKKTTFLLLLFVPLLLAMTCEENEHFPPIGLEGEWQLVHISNDASGYDHDFEKGVISWTFNEGSRSLFVSNKNTEEVNSGPSSLNYHYSIVTVPVICDEALSINGFTKDVGCIAIAADSLKITAAHPDGDSFILVR